MMVVIGNFEHSLELELLLACLENNRIPRKRIVAVPMKIDAKNPFLYYNKRKDIYYKGIEIGMASGTGASVIGASVGFILTWGPVFWGLICYAIGFAVGFSTYLSLKKFRSYKHLPNKLPEVVVIVQCPREQTEFVIAEMWKHRALSVGEYSTKDY